MSLTSLLFLLSVLGPDSERWSSLLTPPREILENLDFFSQYELVDELDVMEAEDAAEPPEGDEADEKDEEIREWRRSIKR